jgi:hypothetical protein
MGTRTTSAILLCMGLGTTACTSAAESHPQAEISDSAGWKIVHSRGSSWAEGRSWIVPVEPKLVLGVLNGPEESQFVEIADAARRSDGSVVVVDQGSRTVRLFGPHGGFRKTLGGPGAGPGEFTDPVSVLVTVGDTVVIWDQARLRATRFTPLGDLAAVQTLDWGKLATRLGVETASKGGESGPKGPGRPSGLFPGPMEPLGDGGFLVRLVEKSGITPRSGGFRPRSGALRISADLSVVDTLMLFGDTEQVVVDAPWGKFSVAPPGARTTHLTHLGPSPRICIGDQEDPEISCFGAGMGKTSLRWDIDPVPLTEDDVSSWREETLRLLDPKLSRDQILEILDQVPLPQSRPPFSQILLDPSGNLWTGLGPTAGGSPGSNDFLVFGPDGILLGLVALPRIRVLDIGRDYVLGVYEDELGIQYIHTYDLRKPSGTKG